jgi:nucleoside-diphosphate-sugar epimerase
MRVLITGADGFVGARVVRLLLAHGHQCHALVQGGDTPRLIGLTGDLQTHVGDLHDHARVAALLRTVRPEACLHAAWTTTPGVYLSSEDNLTMLSSSLALCRGLAALGCRRFVGLGTCFEYDTNVGYLREDSPCAPRTLYGASKHALQTALLAWAPHTSMTVAWARLFFLYGPAEAPTRLVPQVIRSILDNRTAETSAGEQIIDLLHVDDVAAALTLLLERSETGVFNVASGDPVSVRTVVGRIASLLGRPELLHAGALPTRATDPTFVCASIERLRSLGFQPNFSLDEGLLDAIAYWRQQAAMEIPG